MTQHLLLEPSTSLPRSIRKLIHVVTLYWLYEMTDIRVCSYYASLGATLDFSDSLLIFAYERQTASDPESAPYYLECLQDLAEGRKSDELMTKAVLMESEGQFSRKDIPKAYQYFGLNSSSRELDDETIIGSFRSRVGDAPRQEAEMRRALRIIGLDRKSVRIQSEAANCEFEPTNHIPFLISSSPTETRHGKGK